MIDADGRELRALLFDWFTRPVQVPNDDEAFNNLALRIYRYQFERIAPLAAFWNRRGREPAAIDHWTDIPAVPTAAFRELALVAGAPHRAQAIFRTSGTSRGDQRRGTHYILDLSIYHGSLLSSFAAHVLPDGITPTIIALIPPSNQLPDSSLAHMVQIVLERFGAPGSGHFADTATGLDHDAIRTALRLAEEQSEPVCLIGTSFSFVHWTDHLNDTGERFHLPAGSRLMDTGGYKGRTRSIPATELRQVYQELLAIDPDFCVNEYGMTELCSQAYDTSLEERLVNDQVTVRRKRAPPWMRTRIVDPHDLRPIAHGEHGLLQHFDLANLGSVLAVQTEDLGHAVDDGFLVLGRAPAAPPRGCSIAMDELLDATR